ncbi:thiamine diphosphokinase [Paenibacillus sambharensis]|uniref:Thiamine diphosphokinase n=1 Tax=Paenibacillus sambharensis TaxID=1803190 RepID=A0A2W1L2V8_9BACL|nr:thiamine diphosphokinase [Paenibacillus sambharensis]PZD93676.1 thiamine diphosphokinase [Paenibacillus sambharensis]
MQPRVLIFSGGRLGPWALQAIRQDDILIGADSGALFLINNGYTPHLAIGDFDSVTAGEFELIQSRSRKTEACDPVDKDYTDTELAMIRALSFQPSEIRFIGALGTRFDHSIANIHLLVKANEARVPAVIDDAHNEIRLTDAELVIRKAGFDQVSLLPLTPVVTGVTLDGFQYGLTDAVLVMGQSLGISNILLKDEGVISVKSGMLLVIQSRD